MSEVTKDVRGALRKGLAEGAIRPEYIEKALLHSLEALDAMEAERDEARAEARYWALMTREEDVERPIVMCWEGCDED